MNVFLYIIVLIFVFTLISLSQIPSLLKNKQRKELTFVIILLCIGFVLNFLLIIGIKLPNPIKILTFVIRSLL
ncbi:hypothetical protein Desaci_0171 [Desulfosporosinus acidiphilus SJ4]|uniref:Uncharacterized protein n=1 Tax=Desulfosporosinus acidiphilus (strain DSM 22704 / JCM 16185 / SJ4) TaxID=646529 RepID=I4D0C4_DESAJ|nr:hypothetical protein [Desulfosporosinus acidiphilus]AFM39248.1 hypothetical protein Desaci_0171 [Desulfosporosinus acidiphilus SJ4]